MHAPTAGPFRRAGLVAVLVTGVWALTTRHDTMPPVFPLGPQPVYTAVDTPSLVTLEPVLHAPWLGSVPASPALAFLVILGGCGVAVFSGATSMAAFAVLAAAVTDVSFGAALSHAAGLAVAVGLVWLAAGAAFDERARLSAPHTWFHPLAALVLWALAVWWHWVAIVAWPIVWAACRRTPERPARGWWTVASVVLGGAAFVAHFAWLANVAAAITAGPGPIPGWRDALAVAFGARPGLPAGSFVGPELTLRSGSMLLALAAVGLASGSLPRWWRRTVIVSTLLALALALNWPEWQTEVVRFVLWAVAPLAAVGLGWVARQGRRPVLITCLLGAIALTETVVLGARPLEGADARGVRDALVRALDEHASQGPLLIVAEDTRIDSALVAWIASHAPRVQRVVQDGSIVADLQREGRAVLAGPTARRHLELAGVSFVPAITIESPAPYALSRADATLGCVAVRADRWSHLPGVDYTGRLGIHLPPSLGGELHLVVGDTMPLPLRAASPDGRDVVVRQEALSSGPGVSPPPADYWIGAGGPDREPAWIRRVRLAADPMRSSAVSFELGRRSPRVLARLVGYDSEARARVCAAPVGELYLHETDEALLPLADESLFGAGWYGREGRGASAFRWAEVDAVVLVRSAVRTAAAVEIDASPAARVTADDPIVLTLRVNGRDVGPRVLTADRARYSWAVPAGTWLAGTNELWWHTSRAVRPADTGGSDTRSLALSVTRIAVARQGP